MTDLADLVERLRDEADLADNAVIADGATLREAADALTTLQAEKDALRTTNQRLNRRAQELEATIAEDRRILGEASERGFSHNFLAAYHENIALKARVRAAEQALADEREACAKIAERDVDWKGMK